MASEDFIREKTFLTYILTNPVKSQTNAVLDNINLKQAKLLSEIFLNFLKGNCTDTDKVVSKHKRFKEVIRTIGSPSESLSKRRQLIQLHKSKVGSFLKDLSTDINKLITHDEEICVGGTGEILEVDSPTDDESESDVSSVTSDVTVDGEKTEGDSDIADES